jgi:hypothetical protein
VRIWRQPHDIRAKRLLRRFQQHSFELTGAALASDLIGPDVVALGRFAMEPELLKALLDTLRF